mmetsp:Transcript_107342/g.269230  ORF Transcript_107342/g.269230 Transcript_107342/m.269230 type:complete len:103 (-) Transcript_107342:86-394(-)
MGKEAPKEDDDEGEEDAHATAVRQGSQEADAGDGGKKDIEAEIQALIAKARSRIEAVRSVEEENAGRLKTLQTGFKDLKRQQIHVAREQQQKIGEMQNGLQN